MEHTPAGVGLRLGTCAHGHDTLDWTANAVRIRHHEARLIGRVRFEIEDAAGEHVRCDHVDSRLGVNALALEAQTSAVPASSSLVPALR